jgi:hypothetical protein
MSNDKRINCSNLIFNTGMLPVQFSMYIRSISLSKWTDVLSAVNKIILVVLVDGSELG